MVQALVVTEAVLVYKRNEFDLDMSRNINDQGVTPVTYNSTWASWGWGHKASCERWGERYDDIVSVIKLISQPYYLECYRHRWGCSNSCGTCCYGKSHLSIADRHYLK